MRVNSVADVAAVVFYLREDKLWSHTVSTVDGRVGRATEVRNNSGTIRAFDIDYSRQLIYWIDNQNKVPLDLFHWICIVVNVALQLVPRLLVELFFSFV